MPPDINDSSKNFPFLLSHSAHSRGKLERNFLSVPLLFTQKTHRVRFSSVQARKRETRLLERQQQQRWCWNFPQGLMVLLASSFTMLLREETPTEWKKTRWKWDWAKVRSERESSKRKGSMIMKGSFKSIQRVSCRRESAIYLSSYRTRPSHGKSLKTEHEQWFKIHLRKTSLFLFAGCLGK